MKFKLLFLIFNTVVIASFLLIFFMPTLVLGWDYTYLFWSRNWPIGIVFLTILTVLNVYFGVNWKVFALLEKEDWPNLVGYLEERLASGSRLRRHRVRLLINAYVVTGQPQKITMLEERLRSIKPAWVPRLAIELGIPYLLKSEPSEMERFFGEMKDESACEEPLWIRWNHAFALMLQRRLDDARGELMAIAAEVKNPVQELLTAYLCDALAAHDDEIRETVRAIRNRLRGRYTRARWDGELVRNKSNLQVLVLSKLIQDATEWLYSEPGETNE